ncbi:MAG: hypothetical protein ACRD44_13625, partial [Bryobacteraceae bacterium]
AHSKPFWYDEIYTLALGALSARDLLDALRTGLEQNPPLYPLLAGLFGEGHVAARALSIAGVGVFALCLQAFVARRCGETAGWVALLIAMFTEACGYAWEARPYGLVLGFTGLALVFWQRATELAPREKALAGLWLSLAAAMSSHYYAVLLYVPLIAGETVRWRIRRKPDFGLWAALALGALPLAAFVPMMRASGSYAAAFWARPSILSLGTFWEFLLAPLVAPAVVLLAIAAARARRGGEPAPPGLFAYEIAAAIGFCAVPAVLLAIAFVATNAYSDRYALAAAAGVSILAALAADRFRAAGLAFATLFVVFALRQLIWAMFLFTAPPDPVAAHAMLNEGRGEPVAIANGVLYLQLAHYAPDSNFYYLADASRAVRYAGADSVDRALLALRRWRKLQVIDYEEFLQREVRFVIYQSPPSSDGGRLQWLLAALRDQRVTMYLRQEQQGSMILDAITLVPRARRRPIEP